MDVVEGPTYNQHHLLAHSIIAYSWNRISKVYLSVFVSRRCHDTFIAKENVILIMHPPLT
jgi:hypothetical protein